LTASKSEGPHAEVDQRRGVGGCPRRVEPRYDVVDRHLTRLQDEGIEVRQSGFFEGVSDREEAVDGPFGITGGCRQDS